MELPVDIVSEWKEVQAEGLCSRDDAAELFAVLDSAQVWTHIPGARPSGPGELLNMLVVPGRQPLIFRRNEQVLGTSSFLVVPGEQDGIEIGATLLSPQRWGTGVNTVIKEWMIGAGFAADANWIQFRTDERNLRSAAAITKLPGIVEIEPVEEPSIIRSDGTRRISRRFRVGAEASDYYC